MKELAIVVVVAIGGYFAWKHYSAQKAAEPQTPAGASAPAAAPNEHGQNRATAFSGAAPE